MARLYPDEVGYRHLDAGTELTFRAWNEQSNRLARGLTRLGVAKGERVALYLTNECFLQWIVSYVAIHKAGAVAVPVNTRLTPRELTTILNHCEAAAAIVCRETIDRRFHEVMGEVPSLRLPISVDQAAFDILDWSAAVSEDTSDHQVPLDEGDLADIMYTSGTTGLPKGVAVRHRNVALLPNREVPWSGTSWLHSSPPFTFAGISFVFNPMKLGMGGLYQATFDAGRWIDYVELHRPTCVFVVPAMAQLLRHHERWAGADLSSIALFSVGSAPLPPDTLVHLCERLPDATVTNGYGMTEAGPAYCAMDRAEVLKRIGSVGKPMPPMEVRIVDPGTDDDLATGERGEILLRARGREREYFDDPEATAKTWTGEGWLRSGDIGYLDDDGYLYIVGRMKEVIIRGGNNVHATDVEAVLYEHAAVLEAAVIGVPHDVLGEDIAAFVALKDGADATAAEIETFCRARLADYKCPRQITFVDALPRNPTGKVVKAELVITNACARGRPR